MGAIAALGQFFVFGDAVGIGIESGTMACPMFRGKVTQGSSMRKVCSGTGGGTGSSLGSRDAAASTTADWDAGWDATARTRSDRFIGGGFGRFAKQLGFGELANVASAAASDRSGDLLKCWIDGMGRDGGKADGTGRRTGRNGKNRWGRCSTR